MLGGSRESRSPGKPSSEERPARPVTPDIAMPSAAGEAIGARSRDSDAGFRAGAILGLQRTHGNAYVQRALARPTVGRQPTATQATPKAKVATGMTITPGGLATGKKRAQDVVFYGDKLTFKATVSEGGKPNTQASVGGTAAAQGAKPEVNGVDDTTVEMTIVVGQMGKPAKPGAPPEQLTASPHVTLMTQSGVDISNEHTFSLKVIGDLQWLADRATIAGEQGEAAYLGVIAPLKAAFGPYKTAFNDHKHVLEARDKRAKLVADIVLNVFFTAVAGGAGGALQAVIRGQSREVSMAALSTAVGDVGKYIVRLGNQGEERPKTPLADQTKGGGSAGGGVGFDPDIWMAERESDIAKSGKALKDKCVALKLALSEAWAQGKTDLMDQDPVDIIAPYVADLKNAGAPPVKDKPEFARGLWRNWLEQFG